MDWNQLFMDIMPILSELLVAVLSAFLIFLAGKANAYIKANTDESQMALINLVAKQIVLFLEQVGEARGWASSESKKEYAVNRLIAELANLGVAISMEQADVAIEAAVREFTDQGVELIAGEFVSG